MCINVYICVHVHICVRVYVYIHTYFDFSTFPLLFSFFSPFFSSPFLLETFVIDGYRFVTELDSLLNLTGIFVVNDGNWTL